MSRLETSQYKEHAGLSFVLPIHGCVTGEVVESNTLANLDRRILFAVRNISTERSSF